MKGSACVESQYMTVNDVMQVIGCKEGLAYKIIRNMNSELKAKGYLTVNGKVPRRYFQEKIYGSVETK